MERGNIAMIFADSGWKYLDTNLWTRDVPEEDEASDDLDEVIWW
jgi:hypothetical protein